MFKRIGRSVAPYLNIGERKLQAPAGLRFLLAFLAFVVVGAVLQISGVSIAPPCAAVAGLLAGGPIAEQLWTRTNLQSRYPSRAKKPD